MEVNGFPSYYFPPLSILRSGPTDAAVQEARAALTTPNSPPPPNSDILLGSFIFVSQKKPIVEQASPLAALRVLDSYDFLKTRSYQTQIPIVANQNKTPRFAGLQTDALSNIKTSLNSLSSTVDKLLQGTSLNTHVAKSSQPNLVEATAGSGSPVGTLSVVPKRVAAGNVLASNPQPSSYPALGLSGSFVINGYKVPVETSDTIITLKDKINLGEDRNGNGKLDLGEDRNGNGVADVAQSPPTEFGPGVYVVEDRNGNGKLDPSEDLNNNGRLDGGTKEIKVVATIENGRLKLTSLTGGASTIDLQDPNNILLSLGFFELNSKGMPIQKELQFNSVEPPANLNVNPQKAVISVNGKNVSGDTNDFAGIVDQTTLTVKQASSAKVNIGISPDPASASDQIKELFSNFNNAIEQINQALVVSRAFETDPDIQRLRNDLTSKSEGKIPGTTKLNEDIDAIRAGRQNQQEIGFKLENAAKNPLQEFSISNVVQNVKDGLRLPFQSAPNDLLRRLSSVGIQTVADDTFSIDEPALKKALTINTEGVLDLFKNADTGILPQLRKQLSEILQKDIGGIDFKQTKIQDVSNIPSVPGDVFRRFVDNSTAERKVQTLLAVA